MAIFFYSHFKRLSFGVYAQYEYNTAPDPATQRIIAELRICQEFGWEWEAARALTPIELNQIFGFLDGQARVKKAAAKRRQ